MSVPLTIQGKSLRDYLYQQFPATVGHVPLQEYLDAIEAASIQPQTPIERMAAVMERNDHGSDTNQWFGFSTEFFIRLQEALPQGWTLNQSELARMAEDAESDANAKAGDGEYRMEKRI